MGRRHIPATRAPDAGRVGPGIVLHEEWSDISFREEFPELSKIASVTAAFQHHVKLGESPSPESDRQDDDEELYLQHRQRLLNYRGLQEVKMPPSPDYSGYHPADLSKRLPASPPRVPSSLFTIDSILAPRPSTTAQSVSPIAHRLPGPALLRHPLHFGHLAAVASGFAPTSSDFLGTYQALRGDIP
ncbi:hypothetical protein J6590_035092 [Homalodisca vitripennis]|nr:hypothetical protein J6590_089968 [Homalodisca vitripennis]KAG8268124.1 hypothetical protein J6590_035092 [Homalodisca vitripennis]